MTHTMSRTTYQYQPLPSTPDAIRILVLDPGQAEDPLTGRLQTVIAARASAYEAISYVWAESGPLESAYEILIRDVDVGGTLHKKPLALRGGSIFAALWHLRKPNQPRRLWADQCCVNQDDLAERGHQVHLMTKIYENALHVLVWLGLDYERKASAAFCLVGELNQVFQELAAGQQILSEDMALLEQKVRDNHEALRALTDRAWFKRGWIIQEIGTDTPATVIWGRNSVSWETLANVCLRLKSHHQLRSTMRIGTSNIAFLYRRFVRPDTKTHHVNRFNFVYELQRARHVLFSDDRDRVFAFLGHFSASTTKPLGCGPISVTADYTKTVEETYVNATVQILHAEPTAIGIILASVQHPPGRLSDNYIADPKRLPTWVPDWRWSESIILAEPVSPHRAHGETEPRLSITLIPRPMLQICGVEVDSICKCSKPLTASDFYSRRTVPSALTMIEELWKDICGQAGGFNLDARYRKDQSAFFAFMQTLSNGCVQAAGHECKVYKEIPDAVWLQKAASYVVENLAKHGVIDERLVKAATGARIDGEHERWTRWATSASQGRRFAITRAGYYVLGPSSMVSGDVLCVLLGVKAPICLRRREDKFMLVGECYAHELMNGEAIDMMHREEVNLANFDVI